MEQDIRSVLGIEGYQVGLVCNGEEEDFLEIEHPKEGDCSRCGVVSARVHQRASKASRALWGFGPAILPRQDGWWCVDAVLQWVRTMRSWRSEILGYFQLPITDVFTEGCHTKIKLLKRLSYGYRNVEVYIRKMLLGFQPTSLPTIAPHLLT